MQRSTIILFGSVLVLLIGVVLVLQRPGERSVESTLGAPLVAVDSARVTRVDLRTPSSRVTLERRGIDWFVTAPVEDKANVANVAMLLGRAGDLRVKTIVSKKPEKHALFQVDSSGTLVTLGIDGGSEVSFIVGKPSESYVETFVRRTGSNDVSLVDGSLGWVFNRSAKDWRDHTILRLVKDSIRSIGFQYGDTTFSVAFRDSVWKIGDRTANHAAVDGLVSSVATLQCDDFADSVASAKVASMITVGGVQVRFSYDKNAKRYLVQTSNSPRWYVLEAWRAAAVLKRKNDLL